jgi:hypothetical protein
MKKQKVIASFAAILANLPMPALGQTVAVPIVGIPEPGASVEKGAKLKSLSDSGAKTLVGDVLANIVAEASEINKANAITCPSDKKG